jgi:murein DD-endopeptidase MepM/ murein hydrolase activator NlpD
VARVQRFMLCLSFVLAIAVPSAGVAWAEPARDHGQAFGALAPSSGGWSEPDTPVPGSYDWPVSGMVTRGFEPPSGPYGAGHRGIDIAVPFGTSIRAPSDGVVSFAGWIGGALFVSIDHPDGVRTTYSWLSAVAVRKGQAVRRGQVIARTGHGHPEVPTPHLHFGAKIGSDYIDPMFLLDGADVVGLVRLAPLGGA